jgi:cobaltochelatase CobS
MSTLEKLNDRSVRKPCRYCHKVTHGYWFRNEAGRPVLVEQVPFVKALKKGDSIGADSVTFHKDICGADYVTPDVESGAAPKPAVAKDEAIREAVRNALTAEDIIPDGSDVKPWDIPAPVVTADKGQALIDLLTSLIPAAPVAAPVDEATVRAIVEDAVKDIAYPTTTVVVRNRETVTVEGSTHNILATVIRVLGAGQHVMMVGPAGTGKSTIAHQAAETPSSALFGYMDANGRYVRSLFREWYEGGGVFNFDEIDNSHPSILAAINGSLANGHAAFPDGMVARHRDAYAAASANTYGRGADRKYVGRQALDAATLDRFAVVDVNVDEALETALAYATGIDRVSADAVLRYVRAVRAKTDTSGLPVVVSPRASQGLCALLVAGIAPDAAIAMRVRKGLSEQDWQKISSGVTLGPVTVGAADTEAVA